MLCAIVNKKIRIKQNIERKVKTENVNIRLLIDCEREGDRNIDSYIFFDILQKKIVFISRFSSYFLLNISRMRTNLILKWEHLNV